MSNQVMGVTVGQWIGIGAILVVTLALFVAFRRVQSALVRRVAIETYTADLLRRVLMGVVVLVAIVYILDVLKVEVAPLLGGLGISGLIVAVALQPVFANFVGSLLLHGTSAFRPGDEITSNGISGEVVDISHRAVRLIDYDGNSVYIPNMRVLDSTLVNLTADDPRRTLIGFQVAYDSDLRQTQGALIPALAAVEGVVADPPVQVLVRAFGESGIELEAEVWHPAEEALARKAVSEAAITIHETLAADGITIPFPQVVLHQGE